ncbi:hypothetical protein PN398_07950 [Romboutsia sp. 1001216sp1]|uniref:hypothetical protein n=1 Tax=unclassified Romboutsia TaxID=2626894 RepID=UPI00189CC69E|nr:MULTISPECIES: hypothetical protein [unclassified Romboutsia]MDB8790651.1 hypothetical protein [Romboutsia sp. 1001216sp1]MDB8803270.1 hypothetical protein [Romboutsia sp. 1001216sp1]MDB8814622.1 hypothetical protein [Romboutsia sp. 1001216sp1]
MKLTKKDLKLIISSLEYQKDITRKRIHKVISDEIRGQESKKLTHINNLIKEFTYEL